MLNNRRQRRGHEQGQLARPASTLPNLWANGEPLGRERRFASPSASVGIKRDKLKLALVLICLSNDCVAGADMPSDP